MIPLNEPLVRRRTTKPGAWLAAGLGFTALTASLAFSAPAPRQPTPTVASLEKDWFHDVTQKAGIHFVHQFCHHRIANILLSNGSGAAVLDYDNDGWMDIYLLNWGPLDGVTAAPTGTPRKPNRLFRNRGDGTFEDRTAAAGVAGSGFASAVTAGDFDNDGNTDLYVANVGRNILFRNRGDGTFEDVTIKAGVGDTNTGISAVFVDVDNDGWLDLFVGNYLTYVHEKQSEQNPGAYPGPLAYKGEANVLYRNRRDGTFEDITRQAGVFAPGHRAMAVCAFDCDWDGDSDLYVCNDDTPNALWLNDGKGNFKDVAADLGVAFNAIGEAPGSMNAAIGDVNGDAWPDLFITRLGYGSMYVRHARGWYDDTIYSSGLGKLTQKFVGWGGSFLDFDNDGDQDLFIATGDAFTLPGTRPLLLENNGRGSFVDAGKKGGGVFSTSINGRGTGILDYDNDGRLDVLMTALADRPMLLANRGTTGHWLKLRLEGTRSNRSGYGARIEVRAGELSMRAEAICPVGFLTQGDARPHFGLGRNKTVDRLEIKWPSGTAQLVTNVMCDQVLTIREPKP
jgi:hypothetical protein